MKLLPEFIRLKSIITPIFKKEKDKSFLFRKCVAKCVFINPHQQIFSEQIKERAVRYSGIIFKSDAYEALRGMTTRKQASLDFAIAIYLLFLKDSEFLLYSNEVSEVLFGEDGNLLKETGWKPNPGITVLSDVTHTNVPFLQSNKSTSKRYDDCERLRGMARIVSGVDASSDRRSETNNFFEVFPTPPTWFDIAQISKEEVQNVIWSATNTLSHAVSDPNMLSPQEIKILTKFLLDYTGDIPDGDAPETSSLLRTIRHEMVPNKLLDNYSEFSFSRAEKKTRNFRKLRMIHKEKVSQRYQKDLDKMYNQHFDALEKFVYSGDHIDEYTAKPHIEKAMALTSVIHALVIDPSNSKGVAHPFIQDWMYQLRGIVAENPKAISQSIFAELQIVSLENDPEKLEEKLLDLISGFKKSNLTQSPLMQALLLNLAALKQDFFETESAVALFSMPEEKQYRFMARCNIGILPELRDKFVAHHLKLNNAVRPIALSRFGSVMK